MSDCYSVISQSKCCFIMLNRKDWSTLNKVLNQTIKTNIYEINN